MLNKSCEICISSKSIGQICVTSESRSCLNRDISGKSLFHIRLYASLRITRAWPCRSQVARMLHVRPGWNGVQSQKQNSHNLGTAIQPSAVCPRKVPKSKKAVVHSAMMIVKTTIHILYS